MGECSKYTFLDHMQVKPNCFLLKILSMGTQLLKVKRKRHTMQTPVKLAYYQSSTENTVKVT